MVTSLASTLNMWARKYFTVTTGIRKHKRPAPQYAAVKPVTILSIELVARNIDLADI